MSVDFKNQFLVGVQYDRQDWNLYEEQFSDTVPGELKAATKLSLGMRYKPKPNFSPDATMWNRATYRAGIRYGTNYLQVEDIHLEDKAVSLGIGFSLARQVSTINFGIEFGERGTEASNLILEQYTNFYIGVSLSPIERWFTKKQYD